MQRIDQYEGRFRPSDAADRHTLDMFPDLQQVTLSGNFREADMIIQGLKLLLNEAQRAEVTGVRTLLPSTESVTGLLEDIGSPIFVDTEVC